MHLLHGIEFNPTKDMTKDHKFNTRFTIVKVTIEMSPTLKNIVLPFRIPFYKLVSLRRNVVQYFFFGKGCLGTTFSSKIFLPREK
jgi:hypothetical protein